MSKSTVASDLVDFALRTIDQGWIKRNNGRPDGQGRIIVQVPAAEVEGVKIGNGDMLRYRFTDYPRDSTRVVLCPARYVPATAERFTFERETGVPPQVAEFMRQRAAKRA